MTGDRKLRIGLIGVGTVGILHLEAYRELPHASVVAVAEADVGRRNSATAGGTVRAYPDASAMLAAEKLDIVCVLTPASSHEPLVHLCAAAGTDILCEKPLALSPASGRRMIHVTNNRGVRLFYGSSYRFLPALLTARRLIQVGVIGDVLLLREHALGGRGMDCAKAMPLSHYPAGGPGGFAMGLVDHGIHLIDIFGWLTNSAVVSSSGRANRSGSPLRTEFLNIEFDSGALGQLIYNECTFPTELPSEGMFAEGDGWDVNGFVKAGEWAKQPSCIHVYGTRGALRIFHYANKVFVVDETGARQVRVDGDPPPLHFRSQMNCFVDDILAGRPPSTPSTAGVSALEVLFGAYGPVASEMDC